MIMLTNQSTQMKTTPSAHMNRRFVKDFILPIPVCDPEYIEYYINLLDDVYDTKRKYAMFLDLHSRLGGDEEFFQYSSKVQKDALDFIKNSDSYQRFISDSKELFSGCRWIADSVPKGQVYKGVNDGKRFFSIDLVKANYQALRYYSKNIIGSSDLILGTDNFNDFIRKFTDEPYFAEAKKFRQVIFGNMNPKRQQKIQKYIINQVLEYLLGNKFFSEDDLRDYTSDEIVFLINDDTPMDDIYSHLVAKEKELDINLHKDTYTLRWLRRRGEKAEEKATKIFAREFDDGRVDFKNVESSLIPQVYKHYKGIEDLDEKDLLFYHSNGMLAQYKYPIDWLPEKIIFVD